MSAIQAGDLVLVLRGHCAHTLAGMPKTVRYVAMMKIPGHCLRCGEDYVVNEPCAELDHDGFTGWLPLSWLKKIDPLSEPEHVEHHEEIAA